MFIVTTVFLLLCIANCIVQSRILKTSRNIYVNDPLSLEQPNDLNQDIELHILLPALHESSLVNATLDHFLHLSRPSNLRCTFHVITSPESRKLKQTTNSAVTAWAESHPEAQLNIIHDPHSQSKQEKLNRSTKFLLGSNQIDQNAWIAVFDFDSRPEGKTLEEFACKSTNSDFAILQQTPLIRPHAKTSNFGWLKSIDHLRRVLIHETWLIRSPSTATHFKRLRLCMGASLFMKSHVLRRIGYFPRVSDDITLGYIADILQIGRGFLNSRNYVQPVDNFYDYLRQFGRIYQGVFSVSLAFEQAEVPIGVFRQRCAAIATYCIDLYSSIWFITFLTMLGVLGAKGYEYSHSVVAAYIASEFIIAASLLSQSEKLFNLEIPTSKRILFFLSAPFFRPVIEIICILFYFFSRSSTSFFSTPKFDDQSKEQ